MDVAEKLGHVINGEPNPRLGTLGSIKHADHPKLWWHWFKRVATHKNRLNGVAINPEGFPCPRHIRGFRRIVLLMHAPRLGLLTTEDIQWQLWGVAKLLCILTVPWWYKTILLEHHIPIDPQPSWEGITFHDSMGDDKCAQVLAERGLTLDKADDCLDFAFTWIQENNTPEEKEMQLHILFTQTVTMATACPTVEPWREPVVHRFDKTHVRWVPIAPKRKASDENVIAMASARGMGQFTIPSLAEFGQLSLQPSTSGSAEPAAVATETLVEVVAMTTDPPEDPLPPLPESPIIEDDHTIPSLADMVE